MDAFIFTAADVLRLSHDECVHRLSHDVRRGQSQLRGTSTFSMKALVLLLPGLGTGSFNFKLPISELQLEGCKVLACQWATPRWRCAVRRCTGCGLVAASELALPLKPVSTVPAGLRGHWLCRAATTRPLSGSHRVAPRRSHRAAPRRSHRAAPRRSHRAAPRRESGLLIGTVRASTRASYLRL